jgi:aspartyl protease family protein
MTTQWLKGFVLSHPVLCLLMVAGAAFYMARPRLAGIAYVWIGIGFLCFVAFDYFGKKPAATAAQRAGEPPRVATMSVPKNQRGHYETPGSINGQPVTFIVDTGAGVTSVPGSLAKPLGITSCEPRQFSTAAGEVFGCVATVAEVVFGLPVPITSRLPSCPP